MKFVSPFEPLNFWAQGPWVFFNMGLKFMQTWQDECFSRLSLVVPAAGKPLARNGVKPEQTLCEIQLLNKEIAARQGRQMPLLGCLQGVQVVGGPAAEATPKAAAKPAGVKASAPEAVEAVEAEESAESISAASAAPSVTSMLALQAKSLAKAVKVAPAPAVDKKSVAKKVAQPVSKAIAATPVKATAKPAAVAKPAQKAKPAVSAKPAAKTKPAASKKA